MTQSESRAPARRGSAPAWASIALQAAEWACVLAAVGLWATERPAAGASTDGSPARRRQQFPDIHLQLNTVNYGFAAANNQAASQAQGRYFLLLNPDTLLPPGSIEALRRYAESDPKIGVFGPRLTDEDGIFQRLCWRGFPGLGMTLAESGT